MPRLEGERRVSRLRADVFAKLTDFRFLIKCIPDVIEVRVVTDLSAAVVVRSLLAVISGNTELNMALVEEAPCNSAKLRFTTNSAGGNAEVDASFELAEQDGGTLIRWGGELKKVGGMLKLIPKGRVQGSVEKFVNDVLLRIERELSR